MRENNKRFHMRRKDREITTLGEIEQVIRKAIVCHLGLVDNNEAYVVPVNFGYERNAIYFHSALEGRKVNVIRRNDKVCFELKSDMLSKIRGRQMCREI